MTSRVITNAPILAHLGCVFANATDPKIRKPMATPAISDWIEFEFTYPYVPSPMLSKE